MTVSAALSFLATVTEVLGVNTGSAASAKRTVTHDAFNETMTLDASSTPAASQVAALQVTLSAGAATLDLQALTATNGYVLDASALKLLAILVVNDNSNDVTLSEGAVNGYAIPTLTVHSKNGGDFPGVLLQYFADNLDAVAAADSEIDFAGSGSDVFDVLMLFGS